MLNNLFRFAKPALAIDIGTANTIVCVQGFGKAIDEATVVAVADDNAYDILSIGAEALDMCGRAPNGMRLRFPFRRGAIADYSLTEGMIKHFIDKALNVAKIGFMLFGPRVLICVPHCVTGVEKSAFIDAARHAGAQEVFVTDAALASAIGAGLPYRDATGSMIADIGGGTTDVAVVALGGIATQKSVRIGGNNADDDLIAFIRHEYGLIVGQKTAEQLKISLGRVSNLSKKVDVCGMGLESGLPETVKIALDTITAALEPATRSIVTVISDVLSATPPELAADIMRTGITLAGGSAQLYGLKESVAEHTGITVHVAPNPLECVANGMAEILNSIRNVRERAVGGEYSLLL